MMETKHLKTNIEKVIQEVIQEVCFKFNVGVSNQLKSLLVELCFDLTKNLTKRSGILCEKDSRNLLSENHLISILKDLDFERFISEILEEHERSKKEENELKKIST